MIQLVGKDFKITMTSMGDKMNCIIGTTDQKGLVFIKLGPVLDYKGKEEKGGEEKGDIQDEESIKTESRLYYM